MSSSLRPSNTVNTVSARKPDGDMEDDCLYASVSSFEYPNEVDDNDYKAETTNNDYILTNQNNE
jgi:hypothetical protein